LRNFYQCRSFTYTPQYESKIAKKFKRISWIPIQIWLSKNDNIQIHKNARMLQDLNPNVYASGCLNVRLWLFIGHAKDKIVYTIRQGWARLVEKWDWKTQVKCIRLSQKIWIWIICNQTCWNNTEHHFVTHWATYKHVGRQFIAKKGSCNKSAGVDMVRIKCWVCLATWNYHGSSARTFMSTVQLVFNSTPTWIRCMSFWYKCIGCTLHATCFFFCLWKFPQFCVQITAWVLGLQFRFRVRLMLRVKFRGHV